MEEARWSRNAFESQDVLRVELDFIMGDVLDAVVSDGPSIDPSWKKVTITGAHLEIETRNPDDPTDNIIYLVAGDRALFFFEENPHVVIDRSPTWKIAEWRDNRVGGRPGNGLTVENSFGQIKLNYR